MIFRIIYSEIECKVTTFFLEYANFFTENVHYSLISIDILPILAPDFPDWASKTLSPSKFCT